MHIFTIVYLNVNFWIGFVQIIQWWTKYFSNLQVIGLTSLMDSEHVRSFNLCTPSEFATLDLSQMISLILQSHSHFFISYFVVQIEGFPGVSIPFPTHHLWIVPFTPPLNRSSQTTALEFLLDTITPICHDASKSVGVYIFVHICHVLWLIFVQCEVSMFNINLSDWIKIICVCCLLIGYFLLHAT